MQKVYDSKSENTFENKRKASEDLLINFYTEKCQKQVKKIINIKRKIKYYKNNNHQTHIIIIKKL